MPPITQKTCPVCLSTFETNIETKKFCGKKCKLKNRNDLKRDYRNERRYLSRKENSTQKECIICGIQFETHLKKNWCSSECAFVNRKHPCAVCGKKHHPNCILTPKQKEPRKIRIKKQKPIPKPIFEIRCATCFEKITTKNPRQKFCSKKCCNAFLRPEAKEINLQCRFCQKGYKTKYRQKKFCSNTCYRSNEKQEKRKKKYCKVCSNEILGRGFRYCDEHNSRYQLKKKTCQNCSINLTGTSCYKYCKECSIKLFQHQSTYYRKLAKELISQWRHQGKTCVWCNSAEITVDHIIPFKKGGALMDINNLQPMCNLCNISKGNKLPHEYKWCKRYR